MLGQLRVTGRRLTGIKARRGTPDLVSKSYSPGYWIPFEGVTNGGGQPFGK